MITSTWRQVHAVYSGSRQRDESTNLLLPESSTHADELDSIIPLGILSDHGHRYDNSSKHRDQKSRWRLTGFVFCAAACATVFASFYSTRETTAPYKASQVLQSVGSQRVPIMHNTSSTALPVELVPSLDKTMATDDGSRWTRLMAEARTEWFNQTLDHFSWRTAPHNVTVWKQRYIVYDAFWKRNSNGKPVGPIFFYTGNEGDVSLYVNNTGLMWENAESFGALLIFAEHRFYGASQPFPKKKQSPDMLAYLTHEQALADYATLLFQFKKHKDALKCPVIAFGGSYGGMLSAWLRMKYPDTVVGAIAASAPVLAFDGFSPPFYAEKYWEVVTRDATPATGAAEHCASNIRRAWPIVFDYGKTAGRRQELRRIFRTCGEVEDTQIISEWLRTAFDTMAMGNYPYPSSYMTSGNGTLPAWPMRSACSYLGKKDSSDDELLGSLYKAVAVYYNVSGQVECNTLPSEEDMDGGIWDYHFCTEMLPQESYFSTDGIKDMFWNQTVDIERIKAHCLAQFGVQPRPEWIRVSYGRQSLASASNIVFTNGLLDPWSSGGILESKSDSILAVLIPEGAHHLDLFFTNPEDPQSLKEARKVELKEIRKWIKVYNKQINGNRTL